MSGFDELGLMPELVRAVEDLGWHLPRPVQAEAIPLILGGGAVLCAAETGSGKTGAFCLPLLQVTYESLHRGGAAAKRGRCVLNPDDANSNAKVSADGCLCQSHDPRGWSGVRATFGVTRGKWYFEATVAEMSGIVRVGWSTVEAGLELGKDAFGFGYGGVMPLYAILVREYFRARIMGTSRVSLDRGSSLSLPGAVEASPLV